MSTKYGIRVTSETSKQKDPKNQLSKLRRVEAEKKENMQQIEEIQEAGHANRKRGIRAVEKIEKAHQLERQKIFDDTRNVLEQKQNFRGSYKTELANGLAKLLENLDWIQGWTADVVVTDNGMIRIKGKPFSTKDGVLLVVYTPDGRIYHQGMLVTQEPALDYYAVYTLALQLENTMDKERGLLLSHSEPKSDILVSNGHSIRS